MKKYISVTVCVLVVMVVFALLIYPTPYKYLQYTVGSGRTLPIKTNVFTGNVQYYNPESGWEDVN